MTTKPLFHSVYKISTIAAAFFVCLLVCPFAVAAPQINWETDFDQAVTQAKASNRPLFIHFYGDNCPPCKTMETTVFTNPQVVAQMNRDFIALKVNVAEQPLLAKRYTLKAIPTDVVLMPEGQLLIHRREGVITTERFAEYLVHILNTVQKEAVKQQQLAAQNPLPVQNQPPALPEPIRDPFTKQPVATSTPVTPPERYNPARDEKLTGNEFSSSQVTLQTAPAAVSPMSLRDAAAIPSGSPVGLASNSDDIATTMVEVPLGLEGYCPVVLSTEERWIPGNPAYYTMYRGHVFRFSSEEAMVEFMKEPAKYAPVVMGEDIVQMVDRNKKIYGNRKFGAWFQGRVFLFCNQESLDAFGARPEYYAEIALKYEMAFKGPLGRF